MKNYKLTEKQEKIIESLKEAGFEAAWWGRTEIAERIYLNYHKNVKCYVTFDDPAELDGAALKVYIEEFGQHSNWYKSQAQKIREWAVEAFQIITGQKQAEQNQTVVTETLVFRYPAGYESLDEIEDRKEREETTGEI